jgi:hypothetical protein
MAAAAPEATASRRISSASTAGGAAAGELGPKPAHQVCRIDDRAVFSSGAHERHHAGVDVLGQQAVARGELYALGIDFYLHWQALDTTTPAGKAMFQMMGVFAEFEREMIRERVNAGLARAKAKGTKLGRPPVAKAVEDRIRKLRAEGMGVLKISRTLGIGTSVVQRVVSAERERKPTRHSGEGGKKGKRRVGSATATGTGTISSAGIP